MHATHPFRSSNRKLACVATLFFCALSTGAHWSAADGFAPEKINTVDAKITALMSAKHVPGLSVAIARGGSVCFERGYGLADVENQVPATDQTMYRLASVSKMLTAVAAMQLVEQSKLDLAAPIQKYVPAFPEKQAPITAELLLKHQSGIRHYKGDEVRSVVFYSRVADALVIFKDEPLLFTPGEKFSYTTYGFNLLGVAIEAASGQDYVSYVREHVCRPAGMTTIQPDNPYKIVPHRAAGYRLKGPGIDSELLNDFMVDVTNKIPGGGWCSTAGDLARFATALVDGKLVTSQTLERMWTVQKTSGGTSTQCGLGCFIADAKGDKLVFHSGGQPKVSTFLVLSPARKTAVAVMCNLQNTPLQGLAVELLDLVATAPQ
jgi:serine beta-lactamase-like protein LACTB